MSIWKECKIALNSTLSTSSFLPLDKLIENAKLFITNHMTNEVADVKKNINNMLVSTTGVGKVLRTNTITESETGHFDYILEKFVPPVSGLYKIGIEINYTVPDTSRHDWRPPHFDIWSVPVKRVIYATEANDISSSGVGFNYKIKTSVCDTWNYYLNNNIGRRTVGFSSGEKGYIATNLGQFSCGDHSGNYPYSEYKEFLFLCEAGVPVIILAEDINSNTSSYYYRNIHSIRTTVTYG